MRVYVPDELAGNPMAHVGSNYAPDIIASGMAFSRTTYERSLLSLREFEAARARTAEINGCQLCLNWRSERDAEAYLVSLGSSVVPSLVSRGTAPDEAFYASVAEWRGSPLFSARERIAMEYAELLGVDPHRAATDDDFWQRAKAVFSDEEIVDLSYCIACWMGLGRVMHALGLDGICAVPGLAV